MASKNYAAVNIQNDEQEINLDFQDFGEEQTQFSRNQKEPEHTIYFSNFPDSATDEAEQRLLEDDKESGEKKPTLSFWSFEYYQQYFDVESKQVGDRILWSAIPKPGVNYLQHYVRPNPDLYGPFWVCVTLILTTAITGNLADYFQSRGTNHWKYDFHKVTLAASMICSYAWLVPIIIWGILLWRGSKASLTLLELICIYGYSLSVFVPVSILWTIPLPWLQWCLGIVASVLSGGVLVKTVLPAVTHESKKIAIAAAVIILILHAALALGFMLYFFYSAPVETPVTNIDNTVTLKPDVLPIANNTVVESSKSPDSEKKSPSQTKRNEPKLPDVDHLENKTDSKTPLQDEKKISGNAPSSPNNITKNLVDSKIKSDKVTDRQNTIGVETQMK